MKKTVLTIVASLLAIMPAAAQDAEEIISGFISTIEKDGVKCEATILNPSDPGAAGAKAALEMKGERYFMTTPESYYWYDGKTLWNGIVMDGKLIETYVSEPSQSEAAASNPFLMMKHHDGFDISATDAHTIRLTAKDKKKGSYGVREMTVTLDKEGIPSEIRLQMSTNASFVIRIDKYSTGGTAAGDFTYPAAKWPDAEIIDLR